jgi:SNF2 family DNA or RNA helicase
MWTHQQDAVEFARSRRGVIWWIGMGCGKTRAALEACLEAQATRILVCCPKAVIPAWKKQAALWTPDFRVVLLDKGSSAQKGAQVEVALRDPSPVIIVVNYETAWRVPEIEKAPWDVLIYDEAHRLKSASGVTSKWAAKMGKLHPLAKRFALSGTMLAHSPLDAFGIWRAVESPECLTFGKSWVAFRSTYATMNPFRHGHVIGYRNQDQLRAKVAATSFHRKSSAVLDLPPLMHEQVDVELNHPEATVYSEIESEFCAVCKNGTVTPANAMVQVGRLLEVCGGSVHLDGSAEATTLSDQPSKIAALLDLLEDLDPAEPLVVFCRYKREAALICERVAASGRTVSRLVGGCNELADWQSSATSVLVSNTATGGVGVDMTRAAYCVFYSVGHSLSDYDQAIARLHRPGQSRTTHIYNLVATLKGRKTTDGRVYDALRERRDVIDAVVTGYTTGQWAGAAAGADRKD